MFKKSRSVAGAGAALALGIAPPAPSPTARAERGRVLGKVTPSKLDKKKFKPVTFSAGVTTSTTTRSPAAER